MLNRDVFHNFNERIRKQGGWTDWVAAINEEIYKNAESVGESLEKLSSQNTWVINKIENNDAKIGEAKQALQNVERRIESVTDRSNQHQGSIEALNVTVAAHTSSIEQAQEEVARHSAKIAEFDEKIKSFNESALNELSRHYVENSAELTSSMEWWLKGVAVAFILVPVVDWVVFFLLIPEAKQLWYLVTSFNLLLAAILYFVVSQYSYYKRLALEYKNRAVVAKSYLGVLNYASDSERGIITGIVADTLFSRNTTDQGAELPVKEAVKMVELVSAARK